MRRSTEGPAAAAQSAVGCWDIGPAGIDTTLIFMVGVVNIIKERLSTLPVNRVLGAVRSFDRCKRIDVYLFIARADLDGHCRHLFF